MNKGKIPRMFEYPKRVLSAISIKQKLMVIIMSVSLIGLGTVGTSILINELLNLNKMQRIDLQVMADIVADTSSTYLMFDDASGAKTSLTALNAKKQITNAILYEKDKAIFAQHVRGGNKRNITYKHIKNTENINANTFYIWKDILVDKEIVGYLYLESDDSLVKEFINKAVIGLAFILSVGALIAYMIASRLQKIISEPIEHLTLTASKITESQDYSLRAEKESEDEIGVLTDEFNQMLAQLQKRNKELIESENKFKEVVEQSADALFIIDAKGNFIDVNDAACKSLGYKRVELLSLGVSDVDQKYSDKSVIKSLIKRLEVSPQLTLESDHARKDGSLFPVEIRLGYVKIKGVKLVLASVRDITERQNAQKKLQMANDLLEAKVNERTCELKETNIALSEAKERAVSANRAKTLFLANMSHEIRTPMNAVVGFTDVLASSGLNEQQMGYVKSIQSGNRNLLSLINDILDLSKIEAGKMKIQSDRVYVRQLLMDIKQVFSISARDKALDLVLKIDKSVPEVIMSDEVRLRQILFNLVNNAIKFTREGTVKLSAEYKMVEPHEMFNSLVIKVEDTGIGIPGNDQENIFNIFEQQDNQSTRDFGGAGLGLAISIRLAERLNSELTVESEVGKGSCFQLLMKAPEVSGDDGKKHKRAKLSGVKFKAAKILIVDDVDVNRELLGEYLVGQPFEILEASNGEDAVKMVESENPDLVLMDVRMPKMNGVEATQLIKQKPKFKDMPIVAITASVVEDKRADKKRSLFDAVLYKPLGRKALNQCLSKILEIESFEDEKDNSLDYMKDFNQEIKNSSSEFASKVLEYVSILERAKNRGSFGGLDQLLDELCELAQEYNMQEFERVVNILRETNQQFDIEGMQKLLTVILVGMQGLEEKHVT